MKRWKLWALILFTAAGVGGLLAAFRPEPLAVELGTVECGPMRVTVNAEGRTRVRDRFVISAPVTGRLGRVTLTEGDIVDRGMIVALITPTPLDTRTARQNQAALAAAEADTKAAEATLKQARAALDQAARDLERAEHLSSNDVISRHQLEEAQLESSTAQQSYESAAFAVRAAASNAEAIRAALTTTAAVKVTAPGRGRVLRVLEESERIVDAGEAIVEIGDPSKLELVFDVLSSDAVKIRPGAEVAVESWGGDQGLRGRVRTIEPSAFAKVSALGIEEQRVHVVAEIVDTDSPMGDGYRVEGQIVIWENPQVLKVPVSALFKADANWRVFTVSDERAVERNVRIGHRNGTEAEVLDGLVKGEAVVLYPSDKLEQGTAIR